MKHSEEIPKEQSDLCFKLFQWLKQPCTKHNLNPDGEEIIRPKHRYECFECTEDVKRILK